MTRIKLAVRLSLAAMLAVSVVERLAAPEAGVLAFSGMVNSVLWKRILLAFSSGWEAYLAFALLTRRARPVAILVVATLLLYTAALTWRGWEQGWSNACHCFGRLWKTSVGFAIARNLMVVAVATVLFLEKPARGCSHSG